MARYTSALLMVANAVLIFLTMWEWGSVDETLGGALAPSVALLILAALLAARRGDPVGVFAQGVAWVLLAIAGASGLIQGLLGAQFRELALCAALVVIQLCLLAILRGEEEAGRPVRGARVVVVSIVTFFTGLFLLTGGQMAYAIAKGLVAVSRPSPLSVMGEAIPRVQACAIAFATRHDGSYPASLAEMGPAPAGSNCLDAAHASGETGEVRLTYVAGSPDSVGRVTTYHTVAEGPLDKDRPWQYYGDQSGIVRYGDARLPVDSLGISQGGMNGIRGVRACAEMYRARPWAGAYPVNPAALASIPRIEGETEESVRLLGCRDVPSFDSTSQTNMITTYTPLGDDPKQPTDYILEIRPRIYGVTGVRSLRTTARGPVHSTLENRPATDQDPSVPSCQYKVDEARCVPAPGGVPAAVEIVAPDSVAAGERFTFTLKDRRPSNERHPPYQFYIKCNYLPHMSLPEPPDEFTFMKGAACIANAERSTHGGQVVLRAWVRDIGGARSFVERHIWLKPPVS